MQHHAVFDAIAKVKGSRAGRIMREHGNATLGYAKLRFRSDGKKRWQKCILFNPKWIKRFDH